MKNSGHSQNYRTQILKSSFNAFEKMLEEDRKGNKPLYRPRSWNAENRLQYKENKKNNWYKIAKDSEKSYTSIMMVPPTPGSELLKDMKEREYELNKYSTDRIKFVEIEQMLTNKNPFENKRCSDKWCPLCKGDYGEIKIPCNTNNAGYRWICKTCEKDKKVAKVYEGETSRSIRIRTMEHIAGYRNKISSNVLYKHKTLEHINEKVEYKL